MKNLNLLLANPDRRVNTLIEVMIRDLCYNHAVVNIFTVSRLDEFTDLAMRHDFDLAIISPENLRPPSKHAAAPRGFNAALRQIREIKNHRTLPIIAIAVPADKEFAVSSAGVDCVMGLPFKFDELKAAVKNFWNVPDSQPEQPSAGNVIAGLWQRGLQRLTALW